MRGAAAVRQIKPTKMKEKINHRYSRNRVGKDHCSEENLAEVFLPITWLSSAGLYIMIRDGLLTKSARPSTSIILALD